MTISQDKIAINPLQWIATDDGWIDPALAPALPERLKVIREAGIGSVHAEVPADMTAADHGRLLEDHGPAPAPGYIWSPLSEDETSLAELLDKTDRISSQMAELGLFHADITERGRAESWTYRQTVPAGLWAEPGHTSVDIPATVAALPDTFDGWLVIEVDRGAQATPEEGVRLCGEWAQQAY